MLVGDTKAPLLRIVDRPSDIKGIEHRIMNPVQYVPLQKKCFDTVTVSIMLDSGTKHQLAVISHFNNYVLHLHIHIYIYSGSIFSRKNGGGFGISSSHTQLFFYIKAPATRRDASFYVTSMKRKVYCCDGARDVYEEYYHRQNVFVFVGR